MIENLSVFFPAYNEEGNIRDVVYKAKKVLEHLAHNWEIIIVDDGSKDNTPSIVDEIAKKDNRIRVIHNPRNMGYGGALKIGFEASKYKWIAFSDSDGQFDFSQISRFIDKKDEADLILGFREKRADSLARKIFTFGWFSLARLLLGLKARDYSCGFKMIKKDVYQAIQPLVGEEKVTQIEMLVKARKMGFKFAEVGVSHYPRTSGIPTGANLKVVIKSIFDLLKLWGKLHAISKPEFITLLGVLGIGAFLRLYKISQYMTFLGDEGRDMIIVRRLLVEMHPPLIGPGTSIGQMYLGPLYYYMMAIPTLIANFSPVGPAIMVAILGMATIALTWWVGREWSGKIGGFVAALLYAISPTIIIFSKSSWNPNIMPFFSLLAIFSIWKVWKKKEYKWLLILGISYAFVLQSHYLGLLLVPVLFIFWILGNPKYYIRYTIYGAALFGLLMSPLLIFDLRHNFQNFSAMKQFTLESHGSFDGPMRGIENFIPTLTQLNTRTIGGRNNLAGIVVTITLILGTIWLIKKKKLNPILITWIIVGTFGLSMYKSDVFDHYMGFLFPAPFLLFGSLIGFQRKFSIWHFMFGVGSILLVIVSFSANPLQHAPNRQLQRSMEIASFIKDKSGGERFNLATLSERNNRDVYQYFHLIWRAKVVDTDPNAVFYTVTDQLFVVCEKSKELCDPTHDPSAWITNFGWSTIVDHWQVSGVYIYKLGHAK